MKIIVDMETHLQKCFLSHSNISQKIPHGMNSVTEKSFLYAVELLTIFEAVSFSLISILVQLMLKLGCYIH